jgi:hypothetical protein
MKKKGGIRMDENMFFDFSSKGKSEENPKDEILRDMIVAVNNTNELMRKNIEALEIMAKLLYKKDPKKKETKEEEQEKTILFSFENDADGDIDSMIDDFVERLKEKNPNIDIEILEHFDPEADDE